jgi:hypothetical protein
LLATDWEILQRVNPKELGWGNNDFALSTPGWQIQSGVHFLMLLDDNVVGKIGYLNDQDCSQHNLAT